MEKEPDTEEKMAYDQAERDKTAASAGKRHLDASVLLKATAEVLEGTREGELEPRASDVRSGAQAGYFAGHEVDEAKKASTDAGAEYDEDHQTP